MDFPCYFCGQTLKMDQVKCPECHRRVDGGVLQEVYKMDHVVDQLESLWEAEFLSEELQKRLLVTARKYLVERVKELGSQGLEKAAGEFQDLFRRSKIPILSGPTEEFKSPVVVAPAYKLVSLAPEEEVEGYVFTQEMITTYGEEQRETLDSILRLSPKMDPGDAKKLLGKMAEKIATKIQYPKTIPQEETRPFLQAYAKALGEYLDDEKTTEWVMGSAMKKAKAVAKARDDEETTDWIMDPELKKEQQEKREPAPIRSKGPARPSPQVEAFKKLILDNVLWMVSAFLMISGALYFVVSSWQNLSGTYRLAVSSSCLSTLALLLFGGVFLLKKYKISGPASTLSWIGLSIYSCSFVVLSFFQGQLVQPIFLFVLQGFLLLFWLDWLFKQKESREFSTLGLALFLMFGFFHLWMNRFNPLSLGILAYMGVFCWGAIAPELYKKSLEGGIRIILVSLVFFEANIAFHFFRHDPGLLRWMAPLLSAMAFLIAQAWEHSQEPEAPPTFHGLLNLSYTLALFGMLFSFGNQYALLLSSSLTTYLLFRDSLRYKVANLLILVCFSSVIAYFLSPLPIKQVMIQLRDSAAASLGYGGKKLPLAYYGITFFPYLCFLAYLSWLFGKQDRPKHLCIIRHWMVILSLGLLALAHLSTDIRPALFTLPLFMIGCFLFAIKVERRGFGEVALISTALLMIDGVRYFQWHDQGFFWGALSLSLVYFYLSWTLPDDEFLTSEIKLASWTSYLASHILFVYLMMGPASGQGAPALLALGAVSLVIGIWEGRREILALGMAWILVASPLYLQDTSLFLFSLPLAFFLFLSTLFLLSRLWKNSLVEQTWKIFLNFHSPLALTASLILVLAQSQHLTHLHIWATVVIFALAFFVALTAKMRVLSYVGWLALALATVFFWRLGGMIPVGLSDQSWRTGLTVISLYSLATLLVAWALQWWPGISREKKEAILWDPIARASSLGAGLGFLITLALRLQEALLILSPPHTMALLLSSGAVMFVFLISYGREKAPWSAFFALGGATSALLCVADLTLATRGEFLLALSSLPMIYLLASFRVSQYTSLSEVPKAGLFQTTLNFSLYLFCLASPWVLIQEILSFFTTLPLAMVGSISLLMVYSLWAFCRTSSKFLAFAFQILGLFFFPAILQQLYQPGLETLLTAGLVWGGVLILIGPLSQRFLGETKGKIFEDGAITIGHLILIGNLVGGSFMALGLRMGENPQLANYLQLHQLSMAVYLACLTGLTWLLFWIYQSKFTLLSSLLAPVIGLTFYPLLSSHFGLELPVLEYSILALLFNLFPLGPKKQQAEFSKIQNFCGVALNIIALLATNIQLHEPFFFMVLYLISLQFWFSARRDQKASFLQLAYVVELLAHYSLAIYLIPQTGKPPYEILPLFACITLAHQALVKYVLHLVKQEEDNDLFDSLVPLYQLALFLAVGQVALYSLIVPKGSVAGINILLITLDFSVLLYFTWTNLFQEGKAKAVYLFVLTVTFVYLFFFLKTSYLAFLGNYSPHGLYLLALLFAQPSRWGELEPEGETLLQKIGFYYPLLGFFFLPLEASSAYFAGLFLVGTLFYAFHWQVLQTRWATTMAAIFVNLTFFFLWHSMGAVEQLYGISLGLTLIVLAHLTKESYSEQARKSLEMLGFLIVFGSVALQIFQVSSPLYVLLLGVFSLGGIVLGKTKEWSTMVHLGSALLFLDVMGFLLRSNMPKGILAALVLIVAGIGVFLTALALQKRKKKEEEEEEEES